MSGNLSFIFDSLIVIKMLVECARFSGKQNYVSSRYYQITLLQCVYNVDTN
jgi:hypothetical protein